MSALLALALLAAPARGAALDLSTGTAVAISSAVPRELTDLVLAAIVRNIDYRSAKLDIATAEAGYRGAEAVFEPRFDGAINKTMTVTRLRTDPNVVPPPVDGRTHSVTATITKKTSIGTVLTAQAAAAGGETDPAVKLYTGALTVTVAQPLLSGAWRTAAYAAAREALLEDSRTRASTYRAYEVLIANVENSYWALRQAEERRTAALKSRLTAEYLLNRNRQLNERKLLSAFDVIVAESGAATRRAADTDAARARRDAADALVFLVFGEDAPRTLSGDFDVATASGSDRTEPAVPSEEDSETLALGTRRDILAARLALEEAGVALRAAGNGLLPALGVNGSYSRTGAAQTGQPGDFNLANRDALDGRGSVWSAGLTLGLPLGNAAARAVYQAADANLERQRLALATAENAVRQDVRAARRALVANLDRVADLQLGVALAEKEVQGEYRRLDLNLSDSFRVLQAVDNLTLARQTLADAQFDLSSTATRYDLAVGRIADRYVGQP